MKNKNTMQADELSTNERILGLITKAKRFEMVNKINFKPLTRLLKEAEDLAF